MSNFPKIRYGVEGFPIEHDGQRLILIRDRLGYTRESLVISPVAAQILAHMNGQNSIRDLQAHYMRVTGQLLYMEEINKLVQTMDEHLFLENDHFLSVVKERTEQFRQDPIRRMQFAGESYPSDPTHLRTQLDSFFAKEAGGPGLPECGKKDPVLLGLVAPHIDIQAGGACFAYTYKALCESNCPETWVILGTGHEPLDNFLALTVKDFETPLGVVSCDREFCEELLRLSPFDLLSGEYNHRKEHTIEFQAVFFSHYMPRARIVPLLCSFSSEDWERDHGKIDEFAMLLRRLAEGRSVGFMASVDLAHIGPRYGQQIRPAADTIAEHSLADRDLLETLVNCNGSEFMKKICRERNSRNICGVAPLYLLAKILEGTASGQILNHSHAIVDNKNSFVTFASMAFYN